MPRKSRKDLTKPKSTRTVKTRAASDRDLDKSSLPPLRPGTPPRASSRKITRSSPVKQKTIDLHGLIPSKAIDKLDIEMRKAYSEGYLTVRVIHGKGGREGDPAYLLRDRVHRHLHGHNLVSSIDVERTSTGTNQGATIVKFKR
jgi:DNA-nicking Smr family endonuclease